LLKSTGVIQMFMGVAMLPAMGVAMLAAMGVAMLAVMGVAMMLATMGVAVPAMIMRVTVGYSRFVRMRVVRFT
jgi:hypothetical protein